MPDEESSAIAELLSAEGCSCEDHPDDMPEGAARCLACRAEMEWRGLLQQAAKNDDAMRKLELMMKVAKEGEERRHPEHACLRVPWVSTASLYTVLALAGRTKR